VQVPPPPKAVGAFADEDSGFQGLKHPKRQNEEEWQNETFHGRESQGERLQFFCGENHLGQKHINERVEQAEPRDFPKKEHRDRRAYRDFIDDIKQL